MRKIFYIFSLAECHTQSLKLSRIGRINDLRCNMTVFFIQALPYGLLSLGGYLLTYV